MVIWSFKCFAKESLILISHASSCSNKTNTNIHLCRRDSHWLLHRSIKFNWSMSRPKYIVKFNFYFRDIYLFLMSIRRIREIESIQLWQKNMPTFDFGKITFFRNSVPCLKIILISLNCHSLLEWNVNIPDYL